MSEVTPLSNHTENKAPAIFVKLLRIDQAYASFKGAVAPTLQSVLSRDRFLKLTVGSETEHIRLKNKMVQLGLEFKCFNLKQDRPLKILIRGLPSCTSKKAIAQPSMHLDTKC
ncbi:hypothetical protein CEXT_339591 [Caerostris extrusa]|uniref:Uncharacterized protein n=1 Tax=Caerostris extrusa TaxID=172846 RepID=A0AAV4NI23_CAEEX|nr:hypothetical protein CEXT_339591 [Caerostris extrusa]